MAAKTPNTVKAISYAVSGGSVVSTVFDKAVVASGCSVVASVVELSPAAGATNGHFLVGEGRFFDDVVDERAVAVVVEGEVVLVVAVVDVLGLNFTVDLRFVVVEVGWVVIISAPAVVGHVELSVTCNYSEKGETLVITKFVKKTILYQRSEES